ncbi:MAG TPA: Sec-independent protein translocase subunit TatA [Pseudonocardiaceae bacterium]|jgi:sec-independent protein translocase protein TatA|nr:Sec-independent protein translocase subunit TatA [Pseudonocardiaceae bacterium]
MGELSPWHWLVVLLLFALLFGSKRLPDAARGLGRSLRIFKAEMRSAANDETPPATQPQPPMDDAPPAAIPPADTAPVDTAPVDAVPPTVLTDQVPQAHATEH